MKYTVCYITYPLANRQGLAGTPCPTYETYEAAVEAAKRFIRQGLANSFRITKEVAIVQTSLPLISTVITTPDGRV